MEGARLLTVGTINAGVTPIQADVRSLGSDVAVNVTLSADYSMLNPPGFPFRPCFVGTATPNYPHLIPSGTSLALLKCEADALVAAGAAA